MRPRRAKGATRVYGPVTAPGVTGPWRRGLGPVASSRSNLPMNCRVFRCEAIVNPPAQGPARRSGFGAVGSGSSRLVSRKKHPRSSPLLPGISNSLVLSSTPGKVVFFFWRSCYLWVLVAFFLVWVWWFVAPSGLCCRLVCAGFGVGASWALRGRFGSCFFCLFVIQ